MGPGGFGPPPGGRGGYQYEKVPLPKNIGDVPRYLRELLGGFFYRLFYTFVLVWQTDPLILFTMLFISVFDGVTPIIGSLITARITNEMQRLTSERAVAEANGVPLELQFVGSVLLGIMGIFVASFNSNLRDLFVYGLLILVLVIKPSGLMGKVVEDKA